MRQILAIDEFHHERGDGIALFEPVDGRNVWMVQGREHFRFALKTREPIVVSSKQRRQDLDRNLAFQIRVRRPIHLPIPPSPICSVTS